MTNLNLTAAAEQVAAGILATGGASVSVDRDTWA